MTVALPTAAQRAAPATCPWCESPLPAGAAALPGRVVCPACHVGVTSPWPTDAELDAAYATFYRPDSGRFSGPGDALLRRTRGRLARRIDEIAPPGPVLDVGAGDGALLDALQAVGREAVGLEREATRPDVRAGEIADQEGGWAAIVLWHALEHLRAPGAALRDAAERLAPGGVLIIAVPNAASIQARLFGERWFALDLPRHLTHIPAPALVDAARAAGLRPERTSAWRGGQVLYGWVDGLVGALVPGHPSLYDAIRRPEARSAPMSARTRLGALAAAVVLTPLAVAGWLAELATRRGGTVYLEARHA
jgi:SAM-dependent methyltransferase